MVGGFTASEDADVLPCEARVYVHLVYFSAHSFVPAGFCQLYEVVIAFVNNFQSRSDGGGLSRAEMASVMKMMPESILLLDSRCKDGFACAVPAFARTGDDGGGSFPGMDDRVAIFLVRHATGAELQ